MGCLILFMFSTVTEKENNLLVLPSIFTATMQRNEQLVDVAMTPIHPELTAPIAF